MEVKMNKLILTILVLGLVACGKNEAKPSLSNTPDVSGKFAQYLSLTPSETDSNGWLTVDACDGLLWNSLWAVSGGSVNIYKAEITPGQWERNANGQCVSISRDMILGVMFYLYEQKDLASVEAMIDYGEAHGFQMNAESESDGAMILSPDIIATLYEMRNKLGGPSSIAQTFDQAWWIYQTGYLANLQEIHLLLRALMLGSVTDGELSLLKRHSQENPDNAMFSAIYHKYLDGNMIESANIILNTTYFPSNTLPTNNNYCEGPFLWERDEGTSDWQPCNSVITHPGIDVEFVGALIMDKIK
jgi:hypothetical protein